MVLSVCEHWEPQWGGEIDIDGARVLPAFNRLVIMETTDTAYHSVRPVLGPDSRKTLALFWWTMENVHAGRREKAEFVP